MSRRDFVKRTALAGVLVAAGPTLLAACGGDDGGGSANPGTNPGGGGGGEGPPELVSKTFITSSGFTMTYWYAYVAKQEGFWEARGIDMDVEGGPNTSGALQAVLGGQADFTSMGAGNVMAAIVNDDAPVKVVGTQWQQNFFQIVSLPDDPIRTPADMVGRKIGLASPGGSTEELVNLLLASAGIDVTEVSDRPVVGIGPAAFELLSRGEVDAYVAQVTDIAVLQDDGNDLVILNPDDHVTFPGGAFVSSLQLVEEEPEIVEAFVGGLYEALRFSLDESNLDAIVAATREFNPDLTEEVIRLQMPVLLATATARDADRIGDPHVESWEEGQQLMLDAGFIDTTVPVERLVDASFYDAVHGG